MSIAAVLLAPLLLRPLAPRAFTDVGPALSASSLSAFDVAAPRVTSIAAWIHEVGPVSLAIALAGAVFGVLQPASRRFLAPFLGFVLLDTVVPARVAGVLVADPLTPLRALAVSALAIMSGLGVYTLMLRLLELRLPMAKSGAVLLVVFQVTNIALASEDAGFTTDRSRQFAAEEWTDGALGRLEPNAAILVRSPELAFRLWAARLLRGERPDVLIVPVSLLNRGQVALTLLAAEREVEPMLRDFALAGQPSEFSLSKLADVRPLHVQLDRNWPTRLLNHTVVDGMWLEFAPQPLGQSDRKASTTLSMDPLRRVLDAIAVPTVPDASTASVMAEVFRSHSALLSQLGEHEAARSYLWEVSRMAQNDPFTMGLSLKHAIATLARAAASQGRARASKTESGRTRTR